VILAAKRAHGFTLLELMIVLLVSVLGLVAVGSSISSGNQTTKLLATARDIASALHYAHGEALMTRNPVSVTLNLEENSYQISTKDKIYHFPSEIEVSVVVAEEEFSGEGVAGIRFFADGSSTGGRVTLVWGKQLRRLDVNWITGEVSINDEAA
jgi:general secretion pathway protein H